MAVTQATGTLIKNGSIQKVDLDTTTTGQAVNTKVLPGDGLSASSTGVDAGTGDVTLNVTGNLPVEYAANTSPAAPTSGITLFPEVLTGQKMLSSIDTLSLEKVYQSHGGYIKIGRVFPGWGQGGVNTVGILGPTFVGTATTQSTAATTSFLTQTSRTTHASAATAAAVASCTFGARPFLRGNAATIGGFYVRIKWAFSTTATGWTCFVGLCNAVSAFALTTAAPPSAEINTIGIAKDTGDANYQVMSNGASGTATKVNTGVLHSTTTIYAATFFCKPNDSVVYVSLEDLQTGTVFNQTVSSTLPSSTTALSIQLAIGNNATAAAVTLHIIDIHFETPF